MQRQAKNLLSALLAQLGLIKRDSQRLSAIPLTERLKVALSACIALFIVTYSSLQLVGVITQSDLIAALFNAKLA